jgi:hypothetical protein
MLSYVNKNEQDYCNGIMVEGDRLFVVVALAMISPKGLTTNGRSPIGWVETRNQQD